ncbi:Bipolar DNA helicase [Cystobacter fuscus]|uniref:Bipolar DNA helicase n=1 Tax=Cystobacter fuscus TaxID=43 RepID=A0A250JA50_9BACT|nr:ATP-binding protein [Cystobacter fuscus]ATB40438.1 Bipolar DNA helicase [Cystobacter fuscus]
MSQPSWLRTAARRSEEHAWLLGHVFMKYRQLERESSEELATRLGCSLETLAWLALCRRPSADRFAEELKVIAKRFNVEPKGLTEVIRRVERSASQDAKDASRFFLRPRQVKLASSHAGVNLAGTEHSSFMGETLVLPGHVEAVSHGVTSRRDLPIGVTRMSAAIVSHGGTSDASSRGSFRQEMPARFEGLLRTLALAERRSRLSAVMEPDLDRAVGFIDFGPNAGNDNLLTVLTTRENLHLLASQTFVRVKSRADNHSSLGVVVRGPFSDSNAISDGHVEIELLGEELGGKLVPSGRLPEPRSPVFLLEEGEGAAVLGMEGELCLGVVSGHDRMEVRLDPRDKSVLPRHTGIIGTAEGGKSTTVATLIHRAQAAGIATIVFDVEGEYTHVDEPTDHTAMLEALDRRGQTAEGVEELHIHHLVGHASRNPSHEDSHGFSLSFSSFSPYAIAELLDLPETQQECFLKAHDVTKLLLEDFGIFPRPESEEDRQRLLDADEFTTGHPGMTLQHLLDVVNAYLYCFSAEGRAEGRSRSRGEREHGELTPRGPRLLSGFGRDVRRVMARVHAQSRKNEISWKALAGKLHQLGRLKIFDVDTAPGVDPGTMLTPGRVSVIDLSGTDSSQLNNLVVSDLLRRLHEEQEVRHQRASAGGNPTTPVLIILEKAHEFLSASRISRMPVLFEQVTRIARRGRKHGLGLVFATQSPRHLPTEVLGLLNNFIIHQITDSSAISHLRRSVGGIDEDLWERVSRLAPGQAIVAFRNFLRPLMVTVDPAPVRCLPVD